MVDLHNMYYSKEQNFWMHFSVMSVKSKYWIWLPNMCLKCLIVLKFEMDYNSICRLNAEIFLQEA